MEWLTAELRFRTYPKKDKEHWNKVKEGKERTINQIAENNHLPTIFTDAEMKQIFQQKMYGDKGLPTFSYRDDSDREKQEPFDITYYYSKGSEVRCELYGDQVVGVVVSHVPFSETITVLINNENAILPVVDVTRIL